MLREYILERYLDHRWIDENATSTCYSTSSWALTWFWQASDVCHDMKYVHSSSMSKCGWPKKDVSSPSESWWVQTKLTIVRRATLLRWHIWPPPYIIIGMPSANNNFDVALPALNDRLWPDFSRWQEPSPHARSYKILNQSYKQLVYYIKFPFFRSTLMHSFDYLSLYASTLEFRPGWP